LQRLDYRRANCILLFARKNVQIAAISNVRGRAITAGQSLGRAIK
jgi:hypothetical protein